MLLSVSLWTIGRPPSEDSLDVRGRIRTPTRTCEVVVLAVVMITGFVNTDYYLLAIIAIVGVCCFKITANFLPTTTSSGLLSE